MKNIAAVFVTHNPDLPLLGKAISAASKQVDQIYIVDNASINSFEDWLSEFDRVRGVFLGENLGIAAGFNVGIQMAERDGCQYLLLLDQDSVIPVNMVGRFSSVMEHLVSNSLQVAAIGPRYQDVKTGQISKFVRYKWFRNTYENNADSALIISTDFLISSGTFYKISVFNAVGLFSENLFIDHVDTEWCHRATRLGYKFFGVKDVVIDHSLGDGRVRLWLFRWRYQPMHKPFRLYYVSRNSFLLYKMGHVPLKWICGDILRLLRLFLMYVIFSPRRTESIGWFFRGVLDGIQNVDGQAPSAH